MVRVSWIDELRTTPVVVGQRRAALPLSRAKQELTTTPKNNNATKPRHTYEQ
jgi:hypothetical protein